MGVNWLENRSQCQNKHTITNYTCLGLIRPTLYQLWIKYEKKGESIVSVTHIQQYNSHRTTYLS